MTSWQYYHPLRGLKSSSMRVRIPFTHFLFAGQPTAQSILWRRNSCKYY